MFCFDIQYILWDLLVTFLFHKVSNGVVMLLNVEMEKLSIFQLVDSLLKS